MVEAQHTASTMKIVDNSEEQDLLETLLEGSKPTQSGSASALDYLLATPFRYDLRQAPFSASVTAWTHPSDYTATQAIAQIARTAQVGAIQYQLVRDPNPAWCMAVLVPQAFAKPKPNPLMQTWWLAVHPDAVIWRRDNASMTFAANGW